MCDITLLAPFSDGSAFSCFFVETGRAGKECARADGRELWVLGEMYEVGGLREWLLEKGIGKRSLLAACEFASMPEGVDRGVILERCAGIGEKQNWAFDEEVMRAASKEAVKGLATTIAKRACQPGERLGWRYVQHAFRVVEKWVRVNGGAMGGGGISDFFEVVEGLDLLSMPMKVLRETVHSWEMVDPAWVDGLCQRKQASGDNAYEVVYQVMKRHRLRNDKFPPSSERYWEVFAGMIAFDGGKGI